MSREPSESGKKPMSRYTCQNPGGSKGGVSNEDIDLLFHDFDGVDKNYDEFDVEAIEKTVDEIIAREKLTIDFDASIALQKFKSERVPMIKEQTTILSELVEAANEDNTDNASEKARKSTRPFSFRVFPKVSFAAVLLIVFITASSVVVMATLGVLEPIVKWTSDVLIKSNTSDETTVQTDSPEQSEMSPDYQSGNKLSIFGDYSEIDEEHLRYIQMPTFIPEGYTMYQIAFNESIFNKIYEITFSCGDQRIIYAITFWNDGNSPYKEMIEIVDNQVSVFQNNGIEYYVFQNNYWYGVTWFNIVADCTVTGFQAEEDVEMFIKGLD